MKPETIKNTCENNKGNKKDCALRKAWSSISDFYKYVETHNTNKSLNHHMGEFEANKRLLYIYIPLFVPILPFVAGCITVFVIVDNYV